MLVLVPVKTLQDYKRMPYYGKLFEQEKVTEWLVQVKEHGAFEELQVTKDFKGEKKNST